MWSNTLSSLKYCKYRYFVVSLQIKIDKRGKQKTKIQYEISIYDIKICQYVNNKIK